MMANTRIRLAVAMAIFGLIGCEDDPALPPSVGNVGSKRLDAGRSGIEDSGTLDANLGLDEDGGGMPLGGLAAGECRNVESLNVINEDMSAEGFYNAITKPDDLKVTRVVGTWKASCSQPMIDIEMSEGSCPTGRRHKLIFSLDAKAIESGIVMQGENTLTADSKTVGIGVTYTRPTSLEPSGEFGTCPGVSGKVSFVGRPSTKADSRLQAMFQLVLPPCDGGTGTPQSVSGTFNVKLARGLDDICPNP